jgi:hypothetical protein
VYALHSWIDELDYTVEPEVECPDNDPSDAAVVQATTTIGGHDDVEEYVACNVYPLAASFSFKSAPLGMTLVPKVETPLPLFAVGTIAAEHADHFLAKVGTKTERVLGSFGPRKYNALMIVLSPEIDWSIWAKKWAAIKMGFEDNHGWSSESAPARVFFGPD